jgi:hypothetical protein
MEKYRVVRDTREHADGDGWWFDESELCLGTVVQGLKTGDYTIEGLEDVLCIERKASTGEFAKNITEGRFERELERMELFKYPFMILEFTIQDILAFPKNSSIPQYKWQYLKITPQFMMKRFIEYQLKYKTKIITTGKFHGQQVTSSIFKRVVNEQ